MYDLDVSPDGTRARRRRSARSAASRKSACSMSPRSRRRDATPVARFDFGDARCRTASCSRRTAAICTAARTSPASSNIFRYDLDDAEARRRHQRGNRFLPADSARRRRPDRVPLLRRRVRAARIDAHPLEDVSADHVPRRAAGRRASRRQDAGWSGRRRTIAVRLDAADRPASIAWPEACSANRFIRYSRATRTRARSACAFNFSDPLQFNRASVVGVVLAGRRSPAVRTRCT